MKKAGTLVAASTAVDRHNPEKQILPKGDSRQKTKTTAPRRRRRSTEEILDRLMEAACEEFERNGYSGTKTAVIAKKAGVAEALIFSNFGTKARLFHDTIFKPLNRHFLDFYEGREVDIDDVDSVREGSRQYIQELQEFVWRHSRMLMSIVAAQMYATEDVEGLNRLEGLNTYFEQTAAKRMNRFSGKPAIDPRLMSRVSFATILACVIFRDWLFPEGLASKAEINAAITDFIMNGVHSGAAPESGAPSPAKPPVSPKKSKR